MGVFAISLLLSVVSLPVTTLPVAAQAQSTAVQEINRIVDILSQFLTVFDYLTVIAVVCAFLFFFMGIASFIRSDGDGGKLKEAKNKIFWGLIAIFVLVSVWGIVNLLGNLIIGDNPGVRGTPPYIEIFELPEGIFGDRKSESPPPQVNPVAPPVRRSVSDHRGPASPGATRSGTASLCPLNSKLINCVEKKGVPLEVGSTLATGEVVGDGANTEATGEKGVLPNEAPADEGETEAAERMKSATGPEVTVGGSETRVSEELEAEHEALRRAAGEALRREADSEGVTTCKGASFQSQFGGYCVVTGGATVGEKREGTCTRLSRFGGGCEYTCRADGSWGIPPGYNVCPPVICRKGSIKGCLLEATIQRKTSGSCEVGGRGECKYTCGDDGNWIIPSDTRNTCYIESIPPNF